MVVYIQSRNCTSIYVVNNIYARAISALNVNNQLCFLLQEIDKRELCSIVVYIDVSSPVYKWMI
jgi:hypothetical protein